MEAGEAATGLGAIASMRSRRAKRKFVLADVSGDKGKLPLWAGAVQKAWAGAFSETAEGATALELVVGSRKPNTNNSYDSKLGMLLHFCGDRPEPIGLLDLDEAGFIEYVAWHGRRGSVRMTVKAFMPYMSCLNTFLAEMRRPSPIIDPATVDAARPKITTAVKNAIRAAGRWQELADPDAEPGRRAQLPAPVAYAMLQAAEHLCSPQAYNDEEEELEALRPLLASVNTYQWMDRPLTGVSSLWQDFGIALDGREPQLLFFEREAKTNTGGTLAARSVAIPVGTGGKQLQRRLGRLLQRFKDLKTALCPELARKGERFWQLRSDGDARSWTSAQQNEWLQEALLEVDERPPENFAWTAYSFRHGAASAASAAGASLPQIRHIGGWTRGSMVPEKTYIDPLVRTSEAGTAFFGFMAG
jgi:hypothetical protein